MAFTVYDFNSAVQLGTESLIRPFAFGTNWQVIRIGVLCAVNATVQPIPSDIGAPRLGLCTGNKSDYDVGVTDAIWMPFFSTAVSLTIGGVSPAVWAYTLGGTGTTAIQKVGSSTGNIGSATTSLQALSLSPYVRCLMLLDITKGTVGNATIAMTMWTGQNVNGGVDRTRGEFLAAMEATTPVNTDSDTLSTANLPLRTAKDWDSMFVSWSRTVPCLNIYQMAVVRFV